MRLKQVSAYLIKWPFLMPVEHSLARNSSTGNIVLAISLEDGLTGYGEGVPRKYVTGETINSALSFAEKILSPGLLSRNIDLSDPLSLTSGLMSPAEIDSFPAVACALETAFLDLCGKLYNRTAVSFLGGAVNQELTFSAVLPRLDPRRLDGLIHKVIQLDMREVKLKVGHQGDVDLVALVRKALGNKVRLRVDANCAWDLDQATRRLEAMAAYGVESVEQPLPAGAFEDMAELRKRVQPAIIADESLCTPRQAQDLIKSGAVDAFNLRLSKCGGFSRLRQMADLALDSGLSIQMGCQVGELGILSAAGMAFAAAVPNLIHLEGCLTRFYLPDDIIEEDISFGLKGRSEPLEGDGLGVHVRREKLGIPVFSLGD